MSFKITGTGSYFPEKIVTNDDLSKMVDTSDEWITARVGIKQRHVSENETAEEMGYKAAKKALEMSKTDVSEIDLIVASSITGENICPTVAGSIQKMLGASCPAFDVNSACSGFLFALDTAAGFFARKKAKKALVIGAERMSKMLDWTDRSTCVIFGDGAGAVVIEEGENYLESRLVTQGGDDVIKIPSGTNNSVFYKNQTEPLHILMEGQETFKFAVNSICESIKDAANEANVKIEDVKYVVPHQANIRIIQYASKRLKIDIDKFFVNIEKCGNTSSASVPIALDELNRSGKLKEGDLIVLTAFGGGLSSASCIIKW